MLQQMVEARRLPALGTREEMLDTVLREDRLLDADESLLDGNVGYQRRSGLHYLSYRDWAAYMEFIRRHP